MSTKLIKTLQAKRAELEKLQSKVNRELASLPDRFGYDNIDDFIAALRSAIGAKRGGAKKSTRTATRVTRKRAVITSEIKAEVKKLVGAGKTGAEIAKAVGISLPSVQNVKKQLGLVKPRK